MNETLVRWYRIRGGILAVSGVYILCTGIDPISVTIGLPSIALGLCDVLSYPEVTQ
jgi:hypothetical protein